MDIFVANRSFATYHDGERVHVYRGDTVAEGHWLLDQQPDAFEPLKIKFAVGRGDPFADHVAAASIKDLLAEVGDDKEKAQRVLDAEKAGKARSSLVETLEKQLAPAS